MGPLVGTVFHTIFEPGGRGVAAGDGGAKGVAIWKLPNGRMLRMLEVAGRHGTGPRWFALHPAGDRLAAAYGDGTINVWSPYDGILRLELPRRPSGQLFFSPDGSRLYANGFEAIEVYDTRPAVYGRGPGAAVQDVPLAMSHFPARIRS